jgi:hypothetical protein
VNAVSVSVPWWCRYLVVLRGIEPAYIQKWRLFRLGVPAFWALRLSKSVCGGGLIFLLIGTCYLLCRSAQQSVLIESELMETENWK